MTAKAWSAPEKFLFDTSFEQAEQPKKPVEAPPEPTFFEEDLARARAEGLAAGQDAGRQEALTAVEQATAQALASIAAQLPALEESLAAMRERQTRAAVDVAAALIRKIYPRLAGDHGMAEIDAVVADAMARLREEPRIVVRVCDAMLDAVKDRAGPIATSAGFEGRIVFLAQDGMAPGDVRVEWADGGAERDTERLWQEIDQMIRRMAGPSNAPGEAAAPASQTSGAQDVTA